MDFYVLYKPRRKIKGNHRFESVLHTQQNKNQTEKLCASEANDSEGAKREHLGRYDT